MSPHPLALLATLADEDRLRVLAALLPQGGDGRSTEDVAAATGLLPVVEGKESAAKRDASTAGLVARIQQLRGAK